MNAAELIAAVQTTVLDDSYESDDILAILNRGMLEISAGGDRGRGEPKLAPLPNLQDSDTVTLTAGTGTMPDDYQRGLFLVLNSSGAEVTKNDSLTQLIRKYGTQTGTPEEYAIVGRTIHARPSSSETLTVYFYRKPVPMAADGTEPDGIEEQYHHKLLYNYGCKELFRDIEQGIEGRTPNHDRHLVLYRAGLADLEREVGAEDKDPTYIEDSGDYL